MGIYLFSEVLPPADCGRAEPGLYRLRSDLLVPPATGRNGNAFWHGLAVLSVFAFGGKTKLTLEASATGVKTNKINRIRCDAENLSFNAHYPVTNLDETTSGPLELGPAQTKTVAEKVSNTNTADVTVDKPFLG